MKQKKWIIILLIIGILGLVKVGAQADTERNANHTLSPYFFVKSNDSGIDQLPLKSTAVTVNISGVIADVTVNQVYTNEGSRPLEAVYIFPASTRAAVHGMKMTIGNRTITANIQEREKAKLIYEQAKSEGKTTSLLEQHRPNVFQMNVANILPSDRIRVELKYTELLIPTDSEYEFVYPTVVGPRHTNQKTIDAPDSEKWIENPYLHQDEPAPYTFDIKVNLSTGLPIRQLTCTSHQIQANYKGKDFAAITLNNNDASGGNRDFILKYCLSGRKIDTGLLISQGEKENFFLLMLQPPKRVSQIQIPPREYIFIVDVSGSMNGFPLNISKQLIKDLIGNLRPTDLFNVLLFAGGSSFMSERSIPASPKNIRRAVHLIERQRGGGGTRLLPALNKALLFPKMEGLSRTIVIATDGYVSVEKEAFDLIRNNLNQANFFTFGIGSSVNRYIIEGMARVGMGEPFVVTKPKEAYKKAENFRKLIQHPVLTDIKVKYNEFQVHNVEPLAIPDVLADRPVIIFGKWSGNARGSIMISGKSGNRSFEKIIHLSDAKPMKNNATLQYLWARHRLALLSDLNRINPHDESMREIKELGLTYNLLTAYTSFVATDTHIRLENGKSVTIKQPLPLPQGVSDFAVGKGGSAKGMNAILYAPSMEMRTRVSKQKAVDTCDEERLSDKHEKRDKLYKKIRLQLEKIEGVEGVRKEEIRRMINLVIPSIDECYIRQTRSMKEKGQKLNFLLVIDKSGQYKKGYFAGKNKNFEALEVCIIEKLKDMVYPISTDKKLTNVVLTFSLNTN